MKDYYSILGVPREAEADLIKATYIALSKIYHPDVYKGDKKYAEKRMKEINEAYETLSDINKRKTYDDKNKNTSDESSFDDNDFHDEQSSYQNIIKDKWDFAKEYYPSMETQYNELLQLNKSLAWQFQILCVETKSFDNSDKISRKLKNEWFIKYFGEKKEIQEIAFKAIISKKIDVARELNKAVKILGDDAYKIIIRRIKEKYPDFFGVNNNTPENNEKEYKGYEYIEVRYLSNGNRPGETKWKIIYAPKEVSIGMEFDDEEKLKHYVDFKERI